MLFQTSLRDPGRFDLGQPEQVLPQFFSTWGDLPRSGSLIGEPGLGWPSTWADLPRSGKSGRRYWGTWNGSVPNLGGPAPIKSGQVPQPDPIGEHTFPYGYAFWQTGKLAWAELGDLFYPRKVTSARFSF